MNHQHHLESDIVLLDSNSSSHFMCENCSATTRQYKYYDDGLFEQEQTHLSLIPSNIDTSNLTIDITQSMIIHSLQNIKISNESSNNDSNTKTSPEGVQSKPKQNPPSNQQTTNNNECNILDLDQSPNFNDNMIEDDDNFEYNDELNFLISNFDLKDKQNKFMPYIY